MSIRHLSLAAIALIVSVGCSKGEAPTGNDSIQGDLLASQKKGVDADTKKSSKKVDTSKIKDTKSEGSK